jgi:hypothetical protein
MKIEEDLGLGRIKRFGFSALIATVILLIGVIIGATFVFGFGIFMLVVVGILTAVAIVEYIMAIV